jgi:hypothetical protein
MVDSADKRQLDAIKALIKRWTSDPVQFRFVVAIGLFGIGLLGVERPLAGRVASARTANADAKVQARMAEEVRNYADQAREYGPRVQVSADLVDWQNYVLEKLRCTTATLISLEPKVPVTKQPFTVLQMELVARGTSYSQFADFISHLEHGERLVRLEKVRIERQQTSMYLTVLIRGLVRGAADATAAKGAHATRDAKDGKEPKAGKDGKDGAAEKPANQAEAEPGEASPTPAAEPGGSDATSAPATDPAADAGAAPPDGGAPPGESQAAPPGGGRG